MNKILLMLLFVVTTSYAYDGKIKDKYGRTTGYIDVKNNGDTVYKDKYGRKEYTVTNDGKIKDIYGRTTGYIEVKK